MGKATIITTMNIISIVELFTVSAITTLAVARIATLAVILISIIANVIVGTLTTMTTANDCGYSLLTNAIEYAFDYNDDDD